MIAKKDIKEEELITLLKNKKSEGINYLYDAYSASLYGFILRIVNDNTEIAEDLLQETFNKLPRSRADEVLKKC